MQKAGSIVLDSLEISLDEYNRSDIDMSSSEVVEQHGDNKHAAKHGRGPVHVLGRNWCGERPEGEEPQW